jgi:MarR family transcriptional regulator, organic hydroperoxide resistance regulator
VVPPTAAPTEQEAFSAALLEFLRATRRMRGRFGDEGELSLSQYHLLEPLIDDERLATCELAMAAGVSAPTATRMLSGLERDGLVARVPCTADRRVVHVGLTDEGRARVLAKRARGEARRAEIFASLSAGERREAARLLERLAAAIEGLR